ncbi:MAG: hypothetical protein AB7O96_05230 [Pseudobdellovibrionaceae bacterium]
MKSFFSNKIVVSIMVITGVLLSLLVSKAALASPGQAYWSRSEKVSRTQFQGIHAESSIFACLSENGARWNFTMARDGFDSLYVSTNKQEEPYYTGYLAVNRNGVFGSLAKYQKETFNDENNFWEEDERRFGRIPWTRDGLKTRYNVEMRSYQKIYVLKLSRVFNRAVFWTCEVK